MKNYFGLYRECQECKHQFMLPSMTAHYEQTNPDITIYCPLCYSNNVAIIDRKNYRRRL